MAYNIRNMMRQILKGICLVSSVLSCSDVYGDVLTASDYFRRQFERTGGFSFTDSQNPHDPSTGTTGKAVAGYDLIYRERRKTDDTTEYAAGAQRYHIAATLGSDYPTFGYRAGMGLNEISGESEGDGKEFSGKSVSRSGTFFSSGWVASDPCVFSCGVASNLFSNEGTVDIRKTPGNVKDAYYSGLLDAYVKGMITSSSSGVALQLSNESVFNAYTRIINNSGSAAREFVVDVEENAIRLFLTHRTPILFLSLNQTFGWLHKGTVAEKRDQFPISMKGTHYQCEAVIKGKRTLWKPEVALEYDYRKADLQGQDNEGDAFCSVDAAKIWRLHTNLKMKNNRGTIAGVTGSIISSSADKVLFEYYPFTSWLLFLDLPDAVKVKKPEWTLYEIMLHYTCKLVAWKKSGLYVTGGAGGLFVNAHAETVDRERYMGIVPVYRNETYHEYEGKFAVLKASFRYQQILKKKELLFKVQQLVPIPVGVSKNTGSGNETVKEKKPGSAQYFGGFSITCGLTIKK